MDKKKIKIYSLSTTYPESSSSIKHQFVHTLNKELAKLDFDIKTITPHSKGSLTKEKMDSVLVKRFKYLPEDLEINSASIADLVTTTKLGIIKVVLMSFGFFFYTFFECLKEKPDILHAHWAFPGGFIAVVMSIIFKKKSIVTIHGGFALLRKFKLLKRIAVYALNKSSIVITNSNYTKNKIIQLNVNNKNIVRVFVPPNFVEDNSDKVSLDRLRKTFTEPSNKLILFVGRFVEYKGIEYLIKSILEIKNAKVHLIIAGYGFLLDQLQQLTKSLGIENKVTFVVGPSHKELARIRSVSDIFVLPSIIDSGGETEGLGLVILEAMKSGLPVIASSVGGIVDIIENEVNGLLVKTKKPKAIAQAIERLIHDRNLEKKIIENSKETLKQFYPEKIAKEHAEIYQKLVDI